MTRKSTNMLPGFSFYNRINIGKGHVVLNSDASLSDFASGVLGANAPNVVVGKFAGPATLAFLGCSMGFLVCHVFLNRPPLKVFETVIESVPVWKVPAVHSFWPKSYECFKDKTVNGACVPLAVSSKGDTEVSAHPARSQKPPFTAKFRAIPMWSPKKNKLPSRPNASIVANTIPRKPRNVSVNHHRLNSRHARLLNRGECV